MDAPDLSNRVALVTGAGGGIGRAIAEYLALAGATVGVHCHRSLSEAEQVVDGIRVLGGQAVLLQADLADPAQAGTLVERLVQQNKSAGHPRK